MKIEVRTLGRTERKIKDVLEEDQLVIRKRKGTMDTLRGIIQEQT
jgi:hypothetical protein